MSECFGIMSIPPSASIVSWDIQWLNLTNFQGGFEIFRGYGVEIFSGGIDNFSQGVWIFREGVDI